MALIHWIEPGEKLTITAENHVSSEGPILLGYAWAQIPGRRGQEVDAVWIQPGDEGSLHVEAPEDSSVYSLEIVLDVPDQGGSGSLRIEGENIYRRFDRDRIFTVGVLR